MHSLVAFVRPWRWAWVGLWIILAGCNLPNGAATAVPPTATAPLPSAPTAAALPTQPLPTQPLNPPTAAPTAIGAPTQPPAPAFPTSVPEPTKASANPPVSQSGPYAVIGVAANDSLNVRSEAGVNFPVLSQLGPKAGGIQRTGKLQMVGDQRWVEIIIPGSSLTGWVNAAYLTEQLSLAAFCADGRVGTLLDQVQAVVINRDGDGLSKLVSPLHGLTLHYLRAGQVANYSPQEVKFVFDSSYVMPWGAHPGSGQMIKGTFEQQVLPDLLDVLDRPHQRQCATLLMGGTTYQPQWPAQYANINYYALHRPGPAEQELDWRTWLAGVEYVDGQPYLFALVHFFWEP